MRHHRQKTIEVQEHDTSPGRVHVEVVYDEIAERSWASMGGRQILSGTPAHMAPCVEWVSPAVEHAVHEAARALQAQYAPAPEPSPPKPAPAPEPPSEPVAEPVEEQPLKPAPRRRRKL